MKPWVPGRPVSPQGQSGGQQPPGEGDPGLALSGSPKACMAQTLASLTSVAGVASLACAVPLEWFHVLPGAEC